MARIAPVKVKSMKGMTCTATVRVPVVVTREFRVRAWIALHLIALGVWIAGASFNVIRTREAE